MFAAVARTVAIAAGLGLAAIGVVASPAAAVIWAVVGVFVGAVTPSLRRQGTSGGDVQGAGGDDRRTGLRVGGVTCLGGLGLTGLGMLLGPATGTVLLALLLLAALSAWPRLRRRYGRPPARQTGAAERPEVVPAAERPPHFTAEALSTAELCLAWRRSYLALLEATSGPARCEIARLRESLLDELERRDPDGFTRWLDTGARASSDPGRYLTTDR